MGSSVTITNRNEPLRLNNEGCFYGHFCCHFGYLLRSTPIPPRTLPPCPLPSSPLSPSPSLPSRTCTLQTSPTSSLQTSPHKPAPYVDYVDEPVYRCPNYPYCDEAPHALAHLQYEIDALRQRQALVDAHGAAVLALKQEP